ncbi:MAG: prepilin peptidase [Candidatus Heimdallarchaeota archaeon]|nr:prepilin peptidase [Candidatus Heimdallarchaeota archaeon]MCG3255680.1 prepilin peptidase [Candidatus Heimdallarchaeota archaeon]MCK4610754.1 prepilin peptidase [Candidatus Heimdallarchaeota archaeon]
MADPIIVYQTMLYIQMSIVIACLLLGSFMDLIKREVSDIPWLVMAVTGVITSIVLIIFAEDKGKVGTMFGINVGVGTVMGLLLYYTGVMGGADAKAVMALSFNTPVYFFNFAILHIPIYNWVPSIFNTFFNWLLAMVVFYPLPLLFYNIYRKARGNNLFEKTEGNFAAKILMLISGYLTPVEKAKNRQDVVYSEVFDETKDKWEIKHFMQVVEIEEEEKFKKEVEDDIEKTGREKIWVKVLPPGIVFLLIGYIVNILIGNIFFLIFHLTLG